MAQVSQEMTKRNWNFFCCCCYKAPTYTWNSIVLFEDRFKLVNNSSYEPEGRCLIVIDTQKEGIKLYHVLCSIKTKACLKRGDGSGNK